LSQAISERLSEYITTLSFDDLPADVIEKAKLHFLDFIGICLASTRMPWSKAAVEVTNEQHCKGESSIIGFEECTSAINAAFANGVLAHSLEFDDTHIQTTIHPGSAVIPAALATAEEEKLSGRDLILSIILGYEVAIRIARSVYPSHIERGFHITGTVGTFGAAVAASKNLGLKKNQIVDALGLAGTQAAGVFEFAVDGAMSKRIHAGKAAMNGVLAALLARKGVTGPKKIFEGNYGFCKAYSDNYAPEFIMADLDTKFLTRELFLKSYACCGHFQQPMIAAIELALENDIEPTNIKRVIVSTYKSASLPCFKKYDVKTPLEAQLSSMPFAIALALTKRPREVIVPSGFLEDFVEKYDDPQILSLARKVHIQTDPGLNELFLATGNPVCNVRIITRDGKEYKQRITTPRFMTKTEAEKKYMYLSSKLLDEGTQREILRKVSDIDKLEEVEELTQLFRP